MAVADTERECLIEAVTGDAEGAGLLIHAAAEITRTDGEIVMHERHGTGRRLHIRDMRLPFHPAVQDGQIRCQDGAVSREDFFLVRQGERRDFLIEEPAAHKVIVPHAAKLGERLPVMGRKPAETKPGQRKGLRH